MSGTRRVVWSLGGNLGDVQDTLRTAVAGLAAAEGVRVVAVSGVVVTDPVGGVDQADFLNIVVVAEASGTAEELLALGHCLEDAAGRVRDVRWGPRTLDVDLIAVGDEVRHSPDPVLPHPRAHERAFVLVPWLDADPAAHLPGRGPVAHLLSVVSDAGVRRLPGVRVWP